MNSAFPRISQPVSSDRRRSRINGGSLRIHQCPSMSQSCDLNLFAKLLSRFSLFDSVFLRIPTCHSQLPRQILDPLPIVRSELEFRGSHVLLEMRERRCPRDRAALVVFSYCALS